MKFIKKYKKELGVLIILITVMGVVSLLLYDPIFTFFNDKEAMKEKLCSYGMIGQGIFALIMAAQVVFVFLPGEIIEVSAGMIYGSWIGLFICLIGAAIGTCIIYGSVKLFGMRFVNVFFSDEKCKKYKFLQNPKKLSMLIFIIFLIPGTPKDIITYLVPSTDMKLSHFLFTTSIARIPSIISSTMAGNAIGVDNYQFSIMIFGVTAILSIIGMYFYKIKILKTEK